MPRQRRRFLRNLSVLGEFEVHREIGRGGMGTVYEARQRSLDRRVALKVLSAQISASPAAVQRFLREARAAAKLQHEHITSVYAQGEQDGVFYYAMEYVAGRSLYEIINEARDGSGAEQGPIDTDETVALTRSGAKTSGLMSTVRRTATAVRDTGTSGSTVELGCAGKLPTTSEEVTTIARYIATIADALAYAHAQGVVHRDVKPHNLMLGEDGKMKITDFGLARLAEQPGVTVTGEVLGSPLYMSPEQILGDPGQQDHRTDIYSLGATMYEWLTLSPPYPGETRERVIGLIANSEPLPPRTRNPNIPLELETICLKATERDRDQRYQSAGEFADDLRRFLSNRPVKARRAGSMTRFGKYVARHALSAVAIAAVLVAAVMSWALYTQNTELATRSAEVEKASADVAEAVEDRDRLFQLLQTLPAEIRTPLSVAGAAVPMVQGLVQETRAARPAPGSERSDGANPAAASSAFGIAQRTMREFHDALAAEEQDDAEAVGDEYRAVLTQASKMYEDNELAGALTLVNMYLEKRPESWPALRLRALVAALLGRYAETAADARKIMQLSGANPHARIWCALAHILNGEPDEGVSDAQTAITMGGGSPWDKTAGGLVLIQAGQPAEAIAYLDEVLAGSPDFIVALLGRATAFAALKDVDSALVDLSQVVELEQDNADALAARGLQYGMAGRYGLAAADFKKAMEIAGETTDMNFNWAYARLQQLQAQESDAEQAEDVPSVEEGGEDPAEFFSTRSQLYKDQLIPVWGQHWRDWRSKLMQPRPGESRSGGAMSAPGRP